MFENSCLYVGTAFNKPPFVVKGKHPLLGDYPITITPEWTVRNIDGEATVDGQVFKGTKTGTVGIVGKVSFPDGSSQTTPEVIIPIRHLIPTEIFIAPREKAA